MAIFGVADATEREQKQFGFRLATGLTKGGTELLYATRLTEGDDGCVGAYFHHVCASRKGNEMYGGCGRGGGDATSGDVVDGDRLPLAVGDCDAIEADDDVGGGCFNAFDSRRSGVDGDDIRRSGFAIVVNSNDFVAAHCLDEWHSIGGSCCRYESAGIDQSAFKVVDAITAEWSVVHFFDGDIINPSGRFKRR